MESVREFLNREKRYLVEIKFKPLDAEYRKVISFDYLDIARRYFANEAYSGCRFYYMRLVDTATDTIIDTFYNF